MFLLIMDFDRNNFVLISCKKNVSRTRSEKKPSCKDCNFVFLNING